MPTIQRASLVALFLVAAGAVPVTHAATSALGSTICVRAGVAGAAGSGLEYSATGVANVSSVPVDVLCTLFRDNTINTNGMQDLEMAVRDPDSATPGGFICDAISADRNGIGVKQVRRSSTKLGESVLDWGGSVNSGKAKGIYLVRCTVPIGGSIHSLYYQEP
jgi:hypothetical protein